MPADPALPAESNSLTRSPGTERAAGKMRPYCSCICAADEAYALPLAVMLESLLGNAGRETALELYVVDCGLREESRSLIDSSVADRARVHWQVSVRSPELSRPRWGHVTGATYERLLLDRYLPANVERVVWLDADVLVLDDIAPLLKPDPRGLPVSAVRDPFVPLVASAFGVRHWRRLGLERDAPYFNAGVMVVDMDRWRALDVAGRSLAYLHRHGRSVYFNEQEAMNAVLGGAWAPLDDRWNVSANPFHARLQRPGGAGPAILHFAGRIKPWQVPGLGASQDLYFRYLDNTPWRGFRPASTWANRLLSWYLGSRLRRRTWWLENQQLRLRHFWGF